jgi:hypothetical protein
VQWLCETFGFVTRWTAGDHRAQLADPTFHLAELAQFLGLGKCDLATFRLSLGGDVAQG